VDWWNRTKQKPFWIKLLNWEYWPTLAFYWPMFVYGPWLALRTGHSCFFTAANPGIKAGGLGLESKYATLQLLPAHLRPKSILLKQNQRPQAHELVALLAENGLNFPLVSKPDIGFRGLLVQKNDTIEELLAYLQHYPLDIIIQEFLNYPEEVGVLYYRYQNEQKGHISSVTQKEFLYVEGDGQSSVRDLVAAKPRALLQTERLETTHAEVLDQVPQKGQKVNLGVIGNHSKGTLFLNANHLIDEELVNTFDQLADQIKGFNYGRFDLKCRSFEDLKKGQHFKIIELNGVCSEPTHIYDQRFMNYFSAVGVILKQWTIVQKIAKMNHQRAGASYMPAGQMLRALAWLRGYQKRIAEMG
jgi:hypothetical protein